MKVMKFGGTSVGSAQRIRDVAKLISNRGKNIVVLSAMSGTTNSLIQIDKAIAENNKALANKFINELTEKYIDTIDNLYHTDEYKLKASEIIISGFLANLRKYVDQPYSPELTAKEIVAFGELMSTNLMLLYLQEQGINAKMLPALDYMRIDINHEPDQDYIHQHLCEILNREHDADLYITQGFICRNVDGLIDNLLRGGSDYSASLIGAAVLADEVEIWTDIDGMHNNDPRFVEGTSPVHNLHFEEAAELAYFGAKILHPTCILPAKMKNIPVRLLNTMEPDAEGTLINNELRHGSIKAVAAKDDITAIKIKSDRMLLAYGFLAKVFEVFNKYQTSIDMIATSEVGVSLTLDNTTSLDKILEELEHYGAVTVDSDMVIICVVGDLEWKNRGFEAKATEALSDIPVRMISYGGSNYNISFLIRKEDKQRALAALSKYLF